MITKYIVEAFTEGLLFVFLFGAIGLYLANLLNKKPTRKGRKG